MASDEFARLRTELDDCLETLADVDCIDDWTVKELLAVRLWWSKSVLDWVADGKTGKQFALPSDTFSWKETPQLNASIIKDSRNTKIGIIWRRLQKQYERLLTVIDDLTDQELLEVGAFPWAGRYPISRWLSLNTVRQYRTARKHVRAAKRKTGLL